MIKKTEGALPMPNKIFFEITNICNLNCSFCHGTKRKKRFVTKEEFALALPRLKGFGEYLYFHLMGEPTLHPEPDALFDIASQNGFKVILTTNGTLLKEKESVLLNAPSLHKVSISLHSFEANDGGFPIDVYLDRCFDFCEKAAEKGIISVMRLWNIGGKDEKKQYILNRMHCRFSDEWKEIYSGYKLKEKVFLEWGEKFDWPDLNGENLGCDHSCYGLRDQIGVLCDGTVVPCCLDAEGDIALGNIYEQSLEEILESPRAKNLKRSFEEKNVCEKLCKKCGYAYKYRK